MKFTSLLVFTILAVSCSTPGNMVFNKTAVDISCNRYQLEITEKLITIEAVSDNQFFKGFLQEDIKSATLEITNGRWLQNNVFIGNVKEIEANIEVTDGRVRISNSNHVFIFYPRQSTTCPK